MENLISEHDDITSFQNSLLEWYQENKREMPWRNNPSPYRVYVSEIMLQQTRVETVIPYFERFISRVPGVHELSVISDQELLKLWEGLGYYSRAKNMKQAAISLVKDNHANLYDNKKELLTLKGIGDYTAGAIASIAFQEKVTAVDGNVLRVFARIFANYGNILNKAVATEISSTVEKLLPDHHIGDFNQALMEMGALICTPRSPKCHVCPVSMFCLAKKKEVQNELPFRMKAATRKKNFLTVLLIQFENEFALRKREDEKLLGGLWEFPVMEGFLEKDEVLTLFQEMKQGIMKITDIGKSKAVFSHVEWHMKGYHLIVQNKTDSLIFESKDNILGKYPIAAAYHDYLEVLMKL